MKNDINTRIKEVSEEALLAFWAVVAEKFPEATSGDFPPDATHKQVVDSEGFIKLWLYYNAPELSTPEVDSPEWFEQIAAHLRADGFGLDAEAENTGGGIICISVNVGAYRLQFGTANEVWGFDVYANGDDWGFDDDLTNEYALNPATQMTLSSETSNPADCAAAIANTVNIFNADRRAK